MEKLLQLVMICRTEPTTAASATSSITPATASTPLRFQPVGLRTTSQQATGKAMERGQNLRAQGARGRPGYIFECLVPLSVTRPKAQGAVPWCDSHLHAHRRQHLHSCVLTLPRVLRCTTLSVPYRATPHPTTLT